MWIDGRPTPYSGEPWGFDNGAYRDYVSGKQFSESDYRRRLDRAYKVGRPYMAVVPDIVMNGSASLEYSLSWLRKLPPEWPWYMAVQDGMSLEDVGAVVDSFAGIFLGGSVMFKANTAHIWAHLAHSRGKRFHYARCGTSRKIRHAFSIQADSVDSVAPIWIEACRSRILGAFHRGTCQLSLF